MAGEAVLDASAVIALIKGEPGGDVVADLVEGARITAVNLSEVVAHFIREGGTQSSIKPIVDALKMTIVGAEEDLAYAAAAMREATRPIGLSLGDRFCLALAIRTGGVALTSDRMWARAEELTGARVQLIR